MESFYNGNESLQMSNHNIRFYGEIRKKYFVIHSTYMEPCITLNMSI